MVAALAEAYGLGGRPRRAGLAAERARTAVTARIKDSHPPDRRCASPSSGSTSACSVRTGTSCSYEPEQPVRWSLVRSRSHIVRPGSTPSG